MITKSHTGSNGDELLHPPFSEFSNLCFNKDQLGSCDTACVQSQHFGQGSDVEVKVLLCLFNVINMDILG